MCGYIGKISLNQIDSKLLDEANHIQVCRGPDETKSLNLQYKDRFNISLIFNRLAIIDLDTKASQPMFSKEHNSYILFNGEIFNFTELRRELEQKGEQFRTSHSDTEVLLLGISRYGAKFLDKCNGQFSFFYMNLNTGKVILCRDRLGQKPLFYKHEDNELVFSTNLISLVKCLKLNKSDISYGSLNKYINLGVVPSPDTIFQNIYKVRPGSYLEFNLFKNIEFVQEIKYWNIENYIGENQFSNQVFENLFYEACSVRTRSDVPFSSFLSGGIDSTAVTKNLNEVLDSVDTFSIVQKSPKYNEEKWVDFVAHKYNTNQEKVNISNNIYQNEITHSIRAFDEPYADPSSVLTYVLSKEISKKYKVAISGDGGDELLGGYDRFQNSLIKRSILNNLYSKLHNFQPYFLGTGYKFSKYSGDAMKSYFSTLEDTKFSNFLGFEKNNYLNESSEHVNIDLIKKLMINEYKFFLSEMMLVKVDRASMANSLEVRSPFLDHKLIEYVVSTDLKNVITSNPKKPLKQFLASDFDNEFLSRKKMGFSFDIENWIYNNINKIEEEINDGYLMNLLGNKNISNLKNFRTRINSNRIWKLYFIEKYLSNF